MENRPATTARPRTLWQRIVHKMGAQAFLRLARFYPPFFGAGVKVTKISPDFRELRVEMPLRPWTRNYVGTQFGGSLYLMCDPFFMLLVMENLGPDYIVWDKSATIDFLSPGRGKVHASFRVSDNELEEIRKQVERQGRSYPTFEVFVQDDRGTNIARVEKLLSVKRAHR